ncbi:aminoglycoside phosphotransferase [Thioclava dalianensis]|uniref:Aminoglycoside phosphotransferase n=1 Tax=Thioclava dalianensis TaxID=1185766 RepID=A0A074TF85_9RHOB|nr:phosphotransferase [Thioclava dalianensis]KEP70324.1 aminoglycoside phosphotransferase [Thioclava dalianensis]SFN33389.1 hypothetical protein SAMN05216224_104175 [Thioclava dalianensis]
MAESATLSRFLERAGWADARRVVLAGDASARSYDRLIRSGQSAVLMKAVPGPEIERFVALADWLREAGFSAPEILCDGATDGFLLLEDFGNDLAARVVRDAPSRESEIYAQITNFLLELGRISPPDYLDRLDADALVALISITPDWYPCLSQESADRLATAISDLYSMLAVEDDVLCLRDFHAENIVLLDRPGNRGLGLLDFQDAVLCHPAYDLVSALQDARRDVSRSVAEREIARFADQSGIAPDRFAAIYSLLGVQRALRILGIFARLCLRDGKPGYLPLMHRVWANIEHNLTHPALTQIAQLLRASYPAPSPNLISELENSCATRPDL